ncbi:class I SAM-dependent methyltransferase [Nocardia sp. NPDC046473]|uniref:class I SAM-dependent methyltransferase n=1 Tax=Nocardia sp. NPDC046473 TaxID=3155733 RepID=UPI0033CB8432
MDTLLRQTRRVGDFPYPHQAAFLLDNPVRRLFTNPRDTIDQLELSGTEQVLELGPGPGFYSLELARKLTDGRLELFDIQPQMLDKARRKLAAAGCDNVGFHSGDAGAGLPFPDDSFDVAFLAAVIGEVPDKPACIRALARALKPGAQLAFFEHFPDPDRMSVPQLQKLAEPEGFSLLNTRGDRWHDTVRFTRNPKPIES